MSIIDKLKNKFNEMFPDESDPPLSDKIPVVMPNGAIQEYPQDYDFRDGINCIVSSLTYHTHCYCSQMKSAHQMRLTFYGMTINEAKKNGYHYCHQCEQWDNDEEEDE